MQSYKNFIVLIFACALITMNAQDCQINNNTQDKDAYDPCKGCLCAPSYRKIRSNFLDRYIETECGCDPVEPPPC